MPRGGCRKGAGRKPGAATGLTKAIARASDLTLRLLRELDIVTTHGDELEDLIIAETLGDKDTRRRQAMLKAVDLPARAAVLKTLLAATRAWAELARTGKAKSQEPTAGKKALAATAAEAAGHGTEWGSDLDSPSTSSIN